MTPPGLTGKTEVGNHQGDLSAVARTELQALRDEVTRLQTILDSAVDYAIIALNSQGRITEWNAGAEQVTGHTKAEVVGKSGDILLTPEDHQHDLFSFEMSRALTNGRATSERWHLRCDGTRFWASGVLMPLLSAKGTAAGFLYILRDRTETRPSAERLQLLLEVPGRSASGGDVGLV